MIGLLALLPCAVAIFAVLVLRINGLLAAALALAGALILTSAGAFGPVSFGHMVRATADAAVLEILVGSVIFFGLFFVEVSNRSGGLDSIGDLVRMLKLSDAGTLILITLGIGVTLESLTGYGVSMFVTIPLLLKLVSRSRAIALALIGMSLMSWGALSIATLLGAKLAGVPLQALAEQIVTTSGPVAFMLPLLCVLLANRSRPADWVFSLFAGTALLAGIAATTRWIGVEVAGVSGGLAVILVAVISARKTQGLARNLANPALLPFGLLIAAVVAQKLIVAQLNAAGVSLLVATERVSLDLLESPAIALAIVSVISLSSGGRGLQLAAYRPLLHNVATRSWRALTSIFLFLITARLLIETGGIAQLAQLLSRLSAYSAATVITLLGGFGAYATGSGVTSNALFMPSAAATGHRFDATLLFAALQHSGGAHAAMASLPIIAILLAALPDRDPADVQIAMRTGLALAALAITLVIASGLAQLAVSN